ncbi:hypothetical protein PPROV_000149300 [Pycnococcus provasolii]|uniref:Uncharacterized protein n=1 Tax=Pycnococcus provasolii TaxID=41880 RepID=A0A830H7U4_9CHLO|nr:hypothetical protein PPROV_000149300 [Pycnococcus provasolii]
MTLPFLSRNLPSSSPSSPSFSSSFSSVASVHLSLFHLPMAFPLGTSPASLRFSRPSSVNSLPPPLFCRPGVCGLRRRQTSFVFASSSGISSESFPNHAAGESFAPHPSREYKQFPSSPSSSGSGTTNDKDSESRISDADDARPKNAGNGKAAARRARQRNAGSVYWDDSGANLAGSVAVTVGELKRCVAYEDSLYQTNTTMQDLGVIPASMDTDIPKSDAPVAVAMKANALGREADWLLDGRAVSSLPCRCDRCAKKFRYVHSTPVRAYLSRGQRGLTGLTSRNDETFVPVDTSNRADLTPILANAFMSSLPLRLLCPECTDPDDADTPKEWVTSSTDDQPQPARRR